MLYPLGAGYKYAHDVVYHITLPPFSRAGIKTLKLDFTESQYGHLGETPGQLYRMRLMEQAYQAYGGWMYNLEDTVDTHYHPEQVSEQEVHDLLRSFSNIHEKDLYTRASEIMEKLSKSVLEKDAQKKVKAHVLTGELLAAASNIVIAHDLIEQASADSKRLEDYDLLKAGWNVKDSKQALSPVHKPASNALIILGPHDPEHFQGQIVFSKTWNPEYKPDDKKSDPKVFHDGIQGSFTISCIDKDHHTVLDEHSDTNLTLSVGDDDPAKSFEITMQGGGAKLALRLPGVDEAHAKTYDHKADGVYCKPHHRIPDSEDTYNEADPENLIFIEFQLGKNPGQQYYSKSEVPDDIKKEAPYIYKFIVQGHLISGTLTQAQFEAINLEHVSISANFRNAQGLALYNPFAFYFKYPEAKKKSTE
ncbi:MAG: hypothetical protein ACR2PX_15235 [Endozoicomonas sp.]|uniref:hypothetical protein n=1 Tax=Endozoicomonas sp. TaxID=1892382 RepID=UPI003D9BDD5C